MSESHNSEQGMRRRDLAIARCDAISALRLYDVYVSQATKTENVISAVAKTGLRRRYAESDLSYLKRFARLPVGRETAPSRTPGVFRPLIVHPHPRQSEIDVLPHIISMRGVGNMQNRMREG